MIDEKFYKPNNDERETLMLIDFMNISMRNLFVVPYDPTDEEFVVWKAMVFKSLVKLFSDKSPNYVIICLEGGNNWRKDIYPEYKANRGEARLKTKYDFDKFFKVYDSFINELKDLLPNIMFLKVARAEADDLIAVITQAEKNKNVLNISTDRDFYQLYKYNNYKQYDPIKRCDIEVINPVNYLIEKVIVGDAGDNIPQVKRGIGIKTAAKIINCEEGVDAWMKQNNLYNEYERNMNLISFDLIPFEIKQNILSALKEYKTSRYVSNKLFSFMYRNGFGGDISNMNEYDNVIKNIMSFNSTDG